MRRFRPILLLGLAGILAFSTASMVYRWLQAQATDPAAVAVAQVDTVGVAVASFDIPRGTTITAEMLKAAQLPSEVLPGGVFREEELPGLVGRVAMVDVVQNELVLLGKLAPVEGTGGVAALLDPEKRAMAVKVDDEVGVAGFVKQNDRVDLFVTVQTEETESGGGEVIAKLVLANTLVLAIGTELIRTGKDEEAKPVKVITLEVTPEEAEKLALASTRGQFRLALRSPLSKETALTRGATIETLLNSYQGGASRGGDEEGESTQGFTVQVIRGKEVTRVLF
jgi:pilus assembly protein CpaB